MGKLGAIQMLPVELRERIDAYMAHCEESKEIRQLKSGDVRIRAQWPTVIGLCNWLDISKPTYYKALDGDIPLDWLDHGTQRDHPINKAFRDPATGQIDKKTLSKLYADEFARAQQMIEQAIVTAAACGDIDTRIAQLLMSKWGYSPGPDAETSGTVTVKWGSVQPEDADRYSR